MSVWLWVLTLIVFGFILLLIELVVIPGFGLTGILGLFALGIACFLVYRQQGVVAGLITTAASLALIIGVLTTFSRSGFYQRLKLKKTETPEQGFRSTQKELDALVGEEGVSKTALRPSGTAIFKGKRFPVVTEGGFLPPNTKIKVLKVEGNRVVVRKVNEDTTYGLRPPRAVGPEGVGTTT